MSITRQSPHIFSARPPRPGTSQWPASLADHRLDRPQRAEGLAAAHAAVRLGLVEHAQLLARLAAVGQPQARLQRDRVLGAGAGAQAALHAVLLDEAQLRPVGVVGQRGLRAGADAGQAQRAACGVDDQAAEGLAGAGSAIASGTLAAPGRAGGRAPGRAWRACRPARRRSRPAAPTAGCAGGALQRRSIAARRRSRAVAAPRRSATRRSPRIRPSPAR